MSAVPATVRTLASLCNSSRSVSSSLAARFTVQGLVPLQGKAVGRALVGRAVDARLLLVVLEAGGRLLGHGGHGGDPAQVEGQHDDGGQAKPRHNVRERTGLQRR